MPVAHAWRGAAMSLTTCRLLLAAAILTIGAVLVFGPGIREARGCTVYFSQSGSATFVDSPAESCESVLRPRPAPKPVQGCQGYIGALARYCGAQKHCGPPEHVMMPDFCEEFAPPALRGSIDPNGNAVRVP